MSSLWNKIVGTNKKDPVSSEEIVPPKSPRRYTVPSVRSRRSLSGVFGTKRRSLPWIEPANLIQDEVVCQEKDLYPVYNPKNPDHNPQHHLHDDTAETQSLRKRRSWSPSKLSDSMRGRYRTQSRSPSPSKGRLGSIAGTMRAAAIFFYNQSDQTSDDAPETNPVSPSSAKSLASKKSVRFRSNNSVIDQGMEHSSPIPIPDKSAPKLPQIDMDGGYVFGSKLTDHEAVACTARPPDTPILVVTDVESSPNRLSSPDRGKMRLSLDQTVLCKEGVLDRTTPMIAAGVPMENPFDDAAAISKESGRALEAYVEEFKDSRKASDALSKDGPNYSNGILNSGNSCTISDNADAEPVPNPFVSDADTPPKFGRPASPRVPSSVHIEVAEKSSPTAESPQVTTKRAAALGVVSGNRSPSEKYDADSEISDIDADDGLQAIGKGLDDEGTTKVDVELPDKTFYSNPNIDVPKITVECAGFEERVGDTPCAGRVISQGRLGLLSAREEVESILSLGSACSTDILDVDESDVAHEQPRSLGLRPGEDFPESDKENWYGSGSRHTSPVDPIKMDSHPENRSRPVSPPERQIVLPADCPSALNLTATVSGTLPPRRSLPFRYKYSTDEVAEPQNVDNTAFSWFARSAAEDIEYKNADEDFGRKDEGSKTATSPNKLPAVEKHNPPWEANLATRIVGTHSGRLHTARTPSPAAVPLPETVLPIRTRGPRSPSFLPPMLMSNPQVWFAFDDPDFPIVADIMMEMCPADFRRALLAEGLTQSLWKRWGLADETIPPNTIRKLSENDLNDLSSAVSEITKMRRGSATLRRHFLSRRADLMQRFQNGEVSCTASEPILQSQKIITPWISGRYEYSREVSTDEFNTDLRGSSPQSSSGASAIRGETAINTVEVQQAADVDSRDRKTPPNTPEMHGLGYATDERPRSEVRNLALCDKLTTIRKRTDTSEDYGTGSHDQLPLMQHDFLTMCRK